MEIGSIKLNYYQLDSTDYYNGSNFPSHPISVEL